MAIYLSSDWHLITCQYGRKPQINISRLSEIMKELDKLTSKDMFIFMGDMFDDTITFPLHGADEYLDKLNEKISVAWRKIFVRGNNDVMDDAFYRKLGFDEICWAYPLENRDGYHTLISHTSVDLDDPMWINIHGHIHRNGVDPDEIMYYHNPENCINICTVNKREHRLTDINTISYDIEKKRNNMWSPSQEKPGMSRLCQNMAEQVYLDTINKKFVY